MKTTEFLTKINEIGNTENYRLEELRQKVGYTGSIQGFRMMCWRNKIPFTKGYCGQTDALEKLKAAKYRFKNATLWDIKEALGYDGGLDGLAGLLKRHDIPYKKTMMLLYPSDHETNIAKIRELGDTSTMRPKEIMKKIGMEMMNPAQYLNRLKIPFKHKRGRKP